MTMVAETTSKDSERQTHIKWVRSAICTPVKHKLVVKGLGFTRLNQVIERPDNCSDPRHGEEGAASGRDCEVSSGQFRSASTQ